MEESPSRHAELAATLRILFDGVPLHVVKEVLIDATGMHPLEVADIIGMQEQMSVHIGIVAEAHNRSQASNAPAGTLALQAINEKCQRSLASAMRIKERLDKL
jgi:hypothetical protein